MISVENSERMASSVLLQFCLLVQLFLFSCAADVSPTLRPFKGKSFGATITGLNPERALHDVHIQRFLRESLQNHLVLVVHNVSDQMTPEDQVSFSRIFGEVDVAISSAPRYLWADKHQSDYQLHVRAVIEKNGGVLPNFTQSMKKANEGNNFPLEITRVVKEPGDIVAFGEGWHTDVTFVKRPPLAAILIARELPEPGLGNTKFLDMRIAFETLSPDLKESSRKLSTNHTDKDRRHAVHPVVLEDVKNGKESLFVNRHFSREILNQHTLEKYPDQELLQTLLAHVDTLPQLSPEAYFEVLWHPGQMLIWNERFTQHAAQANYATRRELHRTLVSW